MKIGDITTTTRLSNDIEMPVLGLGVYKAEDGKEVINAVQYAFESGYRLIDTASYYDNEQGVGEAVRNAAIPREHIFITSKVWNSDHGYDNTLQAFDSSLNRLGLEYLDLYLIHWPVPGKYVETWRALEKLYVDGRVKAIGVSNCLEHHLQDIMEQGKIRPMVLQNEFHPRLVQQPLLDFCKDNQIQYQGWSPLMRGRILDNPILHNLAAKYGKTVAQIILRWDLQKGVSTIPKSVHKGRIVENASIFDFQLTQEDIKKIDSLDREERTGAHPDDFMSHFKD